MIVNKQLPRMNELKRIINEYQKTTSFPTPTGLLNKLGISYRTWEEYQKKPTPQVHLIEAYFQHIAERIEQLMIYQPDKYKNYKAYEFMLKKLVPSVYGDKPKLTKQSAEERKQQEMLETISNESEIKLA